MCFGPPLIPVVWKTYNLAMKPEVSGSNVLSWSPLMFRSSSHVRACTQLEKACVKILCLLVSARSRLWWSDDSFGWWLPGHFSPHFFCLKICKKKSIFFSLYVHKAAKCINNIFNVLNWQTFYVLCFILFFALYCCCNYANFPKVRLVKASKGFPETSNDVITCQTNSEPSQSNDLILLRNKRKRYSCWRNT